MTKKTRNRLLIGGLAVLLIVVVLLFTFLGGDDEQEQGPEEESPAEQENGLGTSAEIPSEDPDPSPFEPPQEEEEDGQTAARQISELFAERYGSYSNQGQYQNLRDLLPVMTASYRQETEAFLETVENGPPPETYIGFTADKFSTEEVSYNAEAGTAVYDIQLQQVRTEGSQPPETSYPVLRLSLEVVGDEWKVASSEWQ